MSKPITKMSTPIGVDNNPIYLDAQNNIVLNLSANKGNNIHVCEQEQFYSGKLLNEPLLKAYIPYYIAIVTLANPTSAPLQEPWVTHPGMSRAKYFLTSNNSPPL